MKRRFKEVRDDILKVLRDGEEHSYGNLERKANTNWRTIRDHCENLEFFGAVSISKEKKVKITKQGISDLKKTQI